VHRGVYQDRIHRLVADTQQVMFDYVAMGERAIPVDPALVEDAAAALAGFPEVPKRRVNPVQGDFAWDPFSDELNELFEWLDGPIKRVAALDSFVGYHPDLEDRILPQIDDIAAGIEELHRY